MTTTRKTIRKVAKKPANKSAAPERPAPAKNVEVKVEITIMVSTGVGDTRSIDEIRDDIQADLTSSNGRTKAKRVTNMGGYYLVDGRVCLPNDYDPKTRGFKPGAHPPLWAMGPDERDVLARIEREKSRPALAQNPANLRTAKETDEFHKLDAAEKRKAETRRVLEDLHENSEWGKNKKRELEAAQSASKDEFDEDEFSFDEEDEEEPFFDEDAEDDEEDEFEAEWDEDDPMNEEVADEALEEQTSSALAKLKNGGTKTVRKITTVAKPNTKKKVIRRR